MTILADCCENYLLKLNPAKEPPVTCDVCHKQITFDLISTFDESKNLLFKSVSNPQYIYEPNKI